MLKILLPKAEPPSADAADALAIAITHAHHRQSTALPAQGGGDMIAALTLLAAVKWGRVSPSSLSGVIRGRSVPGDVKARGWPARTTLPALPTEGGSRACPSRSRDDRQAQGPDRFLRRGLRDPRRRRRRLSGALLARARCRRLPLAGRRPPCCRSRPMSARTRSSCSASAPITEREWFRLLQTVQGVGAKVALAVLGTLAPTDLANADYAARQGRSGPHAGRRPEGRRAHRQPN